MLVFLRPLVSEVIQYSEHSSAQCSASCSWKSCRQCHAWPLKASWSLPMASDLKITAISNHLQPQAAVYEIVLYFVVGRMTFWHSPCISAANTAWRVCVCACVCSQLKSAHIKKHLHCTTIIVTASIKSMDKAVQSTTTGTFPIWKMTELSV